MLFYSEIGHDQGTMGRNQHGFGNCEIRRRTPDDVQVLLNHLNSDFSSILLDHNLDLVRRLDFTHPSMIGEGVTRSFRIGEVAYTQARRRQRNAVWTSWHPIAMIHNDSLSIAFLKTKQEK